MSKKISIIIPVMNESAGINNTIEQLRSLIAASGRAAEVIVVDGDQKGKTIAAIKDDKVITAVGNPGRASQMNRGAKLAQGEILLFLHADTRLPDDGLALIDAACANLPFVAGAFDLAIDSKRAIFRLIAKTASLRSRLTGIPYGDQAFFFTADYFRSLGGFAEIPFLEDVEIMRRIKKRGEKIVFLSSPVRTSPRRWEKDGIIKRTLHNWLLVSLYIAGVKPQRLTKFYRVLTAGKNSITLTGDNSD
ncbi:MAG: TIGR04283 family arsenosugar biosynthesis glycosyltransferase [Smithella sp.]